MSVRIGHDHATPLEGVRRSVELLKRVMPA